MFGIQPLLHTDENGVPLYMPYNLNITMLAMGIEHIFGFSIIEALVTGLIFSYIQKTDPNILYEKTAEAEADKSLKTAPA